MLVCAVSVKFRVQSSEFFFYKVDLLFWLKIECLYPTPYSLKTNKVARASNSIFSFSSSRCLECLNNSLVLQLEDSSVLCMHGFLELLAVNVLLTEFAG